MGVGIRAHSFWCFSPVVIQLSYSGPVVVHQGRSKLLAQLIVRHRHQQENEGIRAPLSTRHASKDLTSSL